jgi:hypothetical protein
MAMVCIAVSGVWGQTLCTAANYSQFTSCISSYESGSSDVVIEVASDITISPVITISRSSSGTSLTIRSSAGATRTLLRGATGDLFTFNANAAVVLEDVIVDGDKSGNFENGDGSLVRVSGGGSLVMSDGAILRNNAASSSGGGVYVGNGTFTMTGGEISGNVTANSYSNGGGGGVYIWSGTFTMTDGEINGNAAYYGGGGVYIQSGAFIMSNGEINENVAYYGGGVAAQGGTLTMNGGEISENTTTGNGGNGGGVYVGNGCIFTLGGTTVITSNTGDGVVNNVLLENSQYITLSTTSPPTEGMNVGVTKVAGNNGVFVQSGATTKYTQYFYDDLGGTIGFYNGALIIGSHFNYFYEQVHDYATATENVNIEVKQDLVLDVLVSIPANINGATLTIRSANPNAPATLRRGTSGNLFTVPSNAKLILEDIIIDGDSNVDFEDGGGSLVRVSGGSVVMNEGSVARNNVTTNNSLGSGVYIGNGTFTINGGKISENTAINGGGVYVSGGIFTMSSGEINGNTAGIGGGVYVWNGAFTMNGGKISENTTTSGGNGAGVYISNDTGTFTLGGTAIIISNIANGIANNVSLGNNQYITLSTTNTPTEGMSIGITKSNNNGIFVQSGAKAEYVQYFYDDAGKMISSCNGVLTIGTYFYCQVVTYATAEDNVVIEVEKDLILDWLVSIPANVNGKTLTIRSANPTEPVTLTRGVSGNLFTIPSNARLILEDIVIDGDRYGIFATSSGSLVRINSGSLTMNNGAVVRNNMGSGVFRQSGTVNLNGGVIFGIGTNVDAVVSGTYTLNNGVVIAWNRPSSNSPFVYIENKNNGLAMQPTGAAVWAIEGGKSGIAYKNGDNEGFIEVSDVTVITQEEADTPVTETVFTVSDFYKQVAAYATAGRDVIIEIKENLVLNQLVNVPAPVMIAGKTLTIRSANPSQPFTLMRGISGDLFTVSNNAGLILKDIIIDGDRDGDFAVGGGSLVRINSNGRLTMNDGAVVHNNSASNGSGVYVNGGTFTMNDGAVLRNNVASFGGGVYVFGWGIFTMNRGEISGNMASGGGGGVYVSNGSFAMSGGKISDNTASADGGGVRVENSGTFTLGGTAKIIGNASDNAANNVFLRDGRYITISTQVPPAEGMSVSITKTANNGIFVQSGAETEHAKYFHDDAGRTITFHNGSLVVGSHNYFYQQIVAYATSQENVEIKVSEDLILDVLVTIPANTNGATLTIRSTNSATPVTLTRGISGNLFTVSNNARLIFEDIIIDGDRHGAFANGGGSLARVNSGGKLTMNEGVVLRNNTASSGGGVFFASEGSFVMNGGEISGNTASGSDSYGGGVYVSNNGSFIMTGGKISGNTASSNYISGGGGVYVYNASFIMTGGKITGNTAIGSWNGTGGGVYVSDFVGINNSFIMTGGEITKNTAISGIVSSGGGVSGRTFTLGGTAKITDNTANGTVSNVSRGNNQYIVLSTDNPPTDGMNVGITKTTNNGVFVQNGAIDIHAQYFSDDIADREIVHYKDALVIGSHFYYQVEAYATAEDDVAIEVEQDLILDALVNIPANSNGKTLTIRSANSAAPVVLTRGVSGNLFTVPTNARLVLKDIIIDGDRDGKFENGGGSLVNVGGAFTINDGAVLQNNAAGSSFSYGGGVYSSGTFTMSGGTISGNTASNGEVYVSGGTFTMTDGKISGHVVATNSCVFNMSGGEINSVRVDWYGTFNMNGGKISGDMATGWNNKVTVSSDGIFNMNGGVVAGRGNAAPIFIYPGGFSNFNTDAPNNGIVIAWNRINTGGLLYSEGTSTDLIVSPVEATAVWAISDDGKFGISYKNGSNEGFIENTAAKAATTIIAWPTSTPITYGAELTTSTLNSGNASIAGSFVWTDGSIIPTVINSGYSVTFIPDNDSYATVTKNDLAITVNKIPITKPTLAQEYNFTYDGEVKTVELNQANSTYTLSGDVTKTDAGNYIATVTLTNPANYEWINGGETSFNLSWKINKASGPTPPIPTLDSKTGTTITITALPPPGNGQTVEYAISTTNSAPETDWQNGLTFTNLSPGTIYYIFAHTKENANFTTSAPSSSLRVVTDAATPIIAKLQPNAPNARIHNSTLHINGLSPGKTWSVYNISGTLIQSGIANNAEIKVNLKIKGIYIVKYETQTLRIVNK